MAKLMTIVLSEPEDAPDEMCANLQFHKIFTGAEVLVAFKSAIQGLIGSAVEMGKLNGASEDEVLDALFPEGQVKQ